MYQIKENLRSYARHGELIGIKAFEKLVKISLTPFLWMSYIVLCIDQSIYKNPRAISPSAVRGGDAYCSGITPCTIPVPS